MKVLRTFYIKMIINYKETDFRLTLDVLIYTLFWIYFSQYLKQCSLNFNVHKSPLEDLDKRQIQIQWVWGRT